MVRRLSGDTNAKLDPDTYRCETIDGIPLDPTEAIACAMVNAIRCMIVDAKGTVIDLGERRFFTVYRDDQGHWHTLRPDGTEIP